MAILVVCPGCRRRFSVSDQFAGKSGPCPSCKAIIKVPLPTEEVKVHVPESFASGGRTVSGKLATKPIARTETRLRPGFLLGVAGAGLVVLAVTWVLGRTGVFQDRPLAQLVGLLLVSPPLVIAGYSFLRHADDLAPLRGMRLYWRAAICAAAFTGLWWAFEAFGTRFLDAEQFWTWFLVTPPFLVVGALVAFGALDLEFGNGFFLYCFYLLLTIVLRAAAGLGWIWQVAQSSQFP